MDLYRMALPASAPERLTADSSDDFWPVPSPDGREVAFHSWRAGSRDIWVMPLDGGPLEQVTSSPAQEAMPGWAPDGDGLAYALFTGRGGIYTVRRVNGVWQKPVERLSWGFFPAWSPDGRTLAFNNSLSRGALWTMPADSGAPRLMADTAGPRALLGEQVRWSDDGRSIYTRYGDVTGRTYWRVPLDGSAPQHLVTLEGGPRSSGGWGTAVGQIVTGRSEERSDLWVMEVKTDK
jgi:Tol biopolymer transport system component